jgi:flagellar biosynthesis/type III secretory pathway protein FliH
MSETTETVGITGPSAVIGVRLHSGSAAVGNTKVDWLLSLAQREEERKKALAAVAQVATAVAKALDELPATVHARIDEIAGIAVELGLTVARELVGDALAKGHFDPTPTVVRCLRDCVHGSRVDDLVLRLHAEDLRVVRERLEAMPELADEVEKAKFVADPRVPRGAVRAETEAGRLKYDPREALERVCEEIRREVSA